MTRPFITIVLVVAITATCFAQGKEMLSPVVSMTDSTWFLLLGAVLIALSRVRRRAV